MLFVACFGNSNDSRLAQHPRERDLGEGRIMALRDLFERRVFEQSAPVTNRRVGHYWNLMLLAPLQETGFNLPVFQIVENLIGGACETVLDVQQLLHIIDIKIRDTPAFDLSSSPEFLECLDCLREPRASFSPMQKVKVDRVYSETFETALTCFWQFGARRVMRINLRNNEHAIALTLDCISHNFFRAAFAIHLGGIDQCHAQLDSEA